MGQFNLVKFILFVKFIEVNNGTVFFSASIVKYQSISLILNY